MPVMREEIIFLGAKEVIKEKNFKTEEFKPNSICCRHKMKHHGLTLQRAIIERNLQMII